jgi:hypothetical protein
MNAVRHHARLIVSVTLIVVALGLSGAARAVPAIGSNTGVGTAGGPDPGLLAPNPFARPKEPPPSVRCVLDVLTGENCDADRNSHQDVVWEDFLFLLGLLIWLVPFLGESVAVLNAYNGYDAITGDPLSPQDRLLGLFPVFDEGGEILGGATIGDAFGTEDPVLQRAIDTVQEESEDETLDELLERIKHDLGIPDSGGEGGSGSGNVGESHTE